MITNTIKIYIVEPFCLATGLCWYSKINPSANVTKHATYAGIPTREWKNFHILGKPIFNAFNAHKPFNKLNADNAQAPRPEINYLFLSRILKKHLYYITLIQIHINHIKVIVPN